MDILTVVLVLLVLAAIWLVVELIVTVRRARPAIDAARKAAEDLGPVIKGVDELVAQARPGVEQLNPVLTQTTEAIGALTDDLKRVDAILGDVSHVSRAAGNATAAVGDAAESIATRARSLFGRARTPERPAVAAPADEDAPAEPAVLPAAAGEPQTDAARDGYFTYPSEQPADGRRDA
jgi:uncharacterized protein YoxC